MSIKKLSSKDRALLTLQAIFENSSSMVNRSYVIEKIEGCLGNPFPEQMLDKRNKETFDNLVFKIYQTEEVI